MLNMFNLSIDTDPDLIYLSDERGSDFYPFFNYKRKNDYDKIIMPVSNIVSENNLLWKNKQWFTNKTYDFNKKINNTSFIFNNVNDYASNDVRMRKIKLILPTQTKKIVNEWNNLYRFVYNKSIGIFNDTSLVGMPLRDCVKNNAQWGFYPFVLKLPNDLREGAANHVNTDIKAAFKNLSRNNITHFKMKFKKKSCKKWILRGFI